MNKLLAIIRFFLVGFICITCEENVLPKNSVFFINKVNTIITVNDNSGRGMFNDIVVEPYSSTQLTYECPSVGSCAINFVHNYNREQYDVCICFEDYKYNETYTFGYLPSNTDVNENEKCSSCRN
jgi:hypothetical protein|tara:strand:+ start:378 stop:752 length:375 start_codon:yes stop_codon:yes gene_type:complete